MTSFFASRQTLNTHINHADYLIQIYLNVRVAEQREGRAAATDGGPSVEQVEYNGSEKARYIAMISS